MRKRMRRSVDRAIFKRTASSVASANLNTGSYRGGIRL